MTLYIGRHMIGMNKNPDVDAENKWVPARSGTEVSVEYEIIELGNTYPHSGEPQSETVCALMRKVH